MTSRSLRRRRSWSSTTAAEIGEVGNGQAIGGEALESRVGCRDERRRPCSKYADPVANLEPAVAVSSWVPASPRRVWSALTSADERAQWWPGLERLDAAVGGTFVERWSNGERLVTTSGSVEQCEVERALELTWADDDWPAPTRVRIDLCEVDDGTLVFVRHEGWNGLTNADKLVAAHETGWREHLGALARHLARTLRRDAL